MGHRTIKIIDFYNDNSTFALDKFLLECYSALLYYHLDDHGTNFIFSFIAHSTDSLKPPK